MRFWTYSMTSGTLAINTADAALFLSVQTNPSNGQCTLLGGIPFKQLTPNGVNLSLGQGFNLSADTSSPLDGILITWVAGTVEIIVGF
jgi:hypothetical protein